MNKPLGGQDLMRDLHTDRLVQGLQKLAVAMSTRAVTSLIGKVDGVTNRLGDYTEKGGSGLLSAVTGSDGGSGLKGPAVKALTSIAKAKLSQGLSKVTGGGNGGNGGGGGKAKKASATNIVETIDVGVPLQLAYNQWTQFKDFPRFMKKVESVEQESDERLSWRAQVFWSHRSWESTILEQVPDQRIVWRSKGDKGYVDGAVTFHELAPELTRIALILEYHPQGFFEHTGNLWRAQGRRARLEFKHFARHMMAQAILHPDEIEGWRGEIRDGEVVSESEPGQREEAEAEERPPDEAEAEVGADDEYGTDEEEEEDYEDEDYEEEPEERGKERVEERPRRRGARART